MKVKNLMFSGFMAAILTGIACSADAAVVASKEYVDARETSILDTVEQIYQKSDTALTETDVRDEIKAVVGTAESGLIKDVADNKSAISDLSDDVSANTAAIQTLNGDADTTGSVQNQIKVLSELLEIDKKQNTITGDELKALNSGITAEKVADYDNYATTKQDVMSAGNDYVTVANNKVSVNVDGTVAANNTGLVTGGAVYTYALPKPTACEETTCVLSVNRNGQPYWMKLELASGGSSDPETTND